MRSILGFAAAAAFITLLTAPAGATFHFMQIEQVIGGVDGNTGVQAIQLRMRDIYQDQMQNAALVVRNASGGSPVVLIAFNTFVPNQGTGVHVLAATSNFSSFTNPALTPDYVLTNPIPASYLAAGSLTFEDNYLYPGTIYWRLSWGGADYTGNGAGDLYTNDDDGDFNPPFGGPLPSTNTQALLFQGAASALSTNNAADYALTAGAATFTNNASASGPVVGVGDGPGGAVALGLPAPNPVRGAMTYTITLPRSAAARVRVFDPSGRLLRTLLDEELAAGRHAFSWETADGGDALASGIYLLAMEAGGERRVRRFAVVR